MRFRGRDAVVPASSVTAFQKAEYVRAVASVTVSPEVDCAPMRFHSDGFHAFSLVTLRLKNLFIFANSVKQTAPPKGEKMINIVAGIVGFCKGKKTCDFRYLEMVG